MIDREKEGAAVMVGPALAPGTRAALAPPETPAPLRAEVVSLRESGCA